MSVASGSIDNRLQRGQRDRRSGIAADGLEQNGARMDCHRAQLLGDREAMRLVADDDRLTRSGDARQAKRPFPAAWCARR